MFGLEMVISWFSLAAPGSRSPADLRVLARIVRVRLRSWRGRSCQAGKLRGSVITLADLIRAWKNSCYFACYSSTKCVFMFT